MGGSEAAAVQVLTRAVQLDAENKYGEALACYEQGIRLLIKAGKEVKDETKRAHFRKKVEEYLGRAEAMKDAAAQEKALACTHRQIQIEAGETGHSYESVFGPLVTPALTSVVVEDAYIRSTHQIYNFLHLCELLVRVAGNLTSITLHTTVDPASPSAQKERLEEIQESLRRHKVQLALHFSDTLHDREIRLDNGWVVKIGRGLDYFRKADGRFSLGWSDYHHRQCHQTTIDIYQQKAPRPPP